jgi:hypothetical protein
MLIYARSGPEQEGDARQPSPRVQGDRRPWLVVHDHHVVAFHVKPKFRRRDVHVEMLDEVGLRTEGQAANSGVQAIGANHKIKPSGRRPVEDHIDTTVVWMKLIDHLVEQELGICAACVDQDRAEICSWHLNLATFGLPRSDARHVSADVVNEDQFAHLGSGLL